MSLILLPFYSLLKVIHGWVGGGVARDGGPSDYSVTPSPLDLGIWGLGLDNNCLLVLTYTVLLYSKPWSLVRSSIFSKLSINYIRVTNFSQFLLHQASVHSFKLSVSILKFISSLSLPYWAKDVLASPSVLLSITCSRPRKHDTICTTSQLTQSLNSFGSLNRHVWWRQLSRSADD